MDEGKGEIGNIGEKDHELSEQFKESTEELSMFFAREIFKKINKIDMEDEDKLLLFLTVIQNIHTLVLKNYDPKTRKKLLKHFLARSEIINSFLDSDG